MVLIIESFAESATRMKLLNPIREKLEDYDSIEEALIRLMEKEIYIPLLHLLGSSSKALKNSKDDLIESIQSGRLVYSKGRFSGRLNSTLTRELRGIGAEWQRVHGCYSLPYSKLPVEIRQAISMSEQRFNERTEKISKQLKDILPEQIAEKLNLDKLFDTTLFRVEKEFQKSIKGIVISPEITPTTRRRISQEYTKNMQIYIKDWIEKETVELRQRVEERALKGDRYDGLSKEIQASYGVSRKKARFLARQETSLFMTKLKQDRYQAAGVDDYIWKCVPGTPNHPVRPAHKILDGKTFSWSNPPIVNNNGDRKNPGQDFGCRCYARPIVRF